MSSLDGAISITQLAIPGTHDSGAYQRTIKPMTRTQRLSIPDQLEVGVRALDIRCAATYGSRRGLLGRGAPRYNVFHGPFDQGISIAQVVQQLVSFLDRHPGETLLLLLKQEGGRADISEPLNQVVNEGLGKRLWAALEHPRSWPSLGACRGKVLVFSRLNVPGENHYDTRDWPDNPETATIRNLGTHGTRDDPRCIVLQDLYKSTCLDDKKKAVDIALAAALEAARSDPSKSTLYLGFSSFVHSPWQPVSSGRKHMTPHLLQTREGAGVLSVDAVTAELAGHIIGWNEPRPA